MKNILKNSLLICILFLFPLEAKRRKTKRFSSKKTYVKKQPFEGLGKRSKANGRLKMNFASGHFKRTRKGFTYVNAYSKSS